MTFAGALRAYFEGVPAIELAAFIKACSQQEREDYARQLTDILGQQVDVGQAKA